MKIDACAIGTLALFFVPTAWAVVVMFRERGRAMRDRT